jgi:hypothetical protein
MLHIGVLISYYKKKRIEHVNIRGTCRTQRINDTTQGRETTLIDVCNDKSRLVYYNGISLLIYHYKLCQ